ncbi:hypothetical protein [Oricola sp.]|uniref:hypothetical protein n=1 Tax=Oricola sp. TaxID=1979950 RepID=UPI003BAA5564
MLARLRQMQAALNSTEHLLRLGRLFSETVQLRVDDHEYYLTFEKGALVEIAEGPSRKTPYRFAFVTDGEALSRFWRPCPEPGFHDIFGLVKIGRGRVEGDILMLVKNLRFFKEFMALARKKETVR